MAILPGRGAARNGDLVPKIEVFEKNDRLITRVDLPGMKKDDVSVEVTDGHLALSGERKRETEEKKGTFYRSEREYGSFYRAVPLPEGVKLDDVKATFADGVLEVSIPLPALQWVRIGHQTARNRFTSCANLIARTISR